MYKLMVGYRNNRPLSLIKAIVTSLGGSAYINPPRIAGGIFPNRKRDTKSLNEKMKELFVEPISDWLNGSPMPDSAFKNELADW